MALILGNRDSLIKVISSKDTAVTCDDEAFEEYLKTLDEDLLGLVPGVEPTRFVMKKVLSQKDDIAVKNETVSVDTKGNTIFKLGFMQKTIQMALVRIEQPSTLAEEDKINPKIEHGKVDSETISWLDQVGVLNELYKAHQNAVSGTKQPIVKKS